MHGSRLDTPTPPSRPECREAALPGLLRHLILLAVAGGMVGACSSRTPEGDPAGATRDVGGDARVDASTGDAGGGDASDVALGGGSCGPVRNPDGSGAWRLLCDGDPVGNFLSVWGSGPDDVYMVGGRSSVAGSEGETAVFHWNGSRLEKLETPGTERAWWVFGTDRNHVYVVGENGLGLKRIDGGAFVPFETGIDQTIFGAWGPSPDRIYLVSGSFRRPKARGEIHVLTPDGVRQVHAPALDNFGGRALFKVWGAGPNEIFASGANGAIFHYDGDRWTRMKTPGESAPILTLSGRSGDEVYGVGGTTEAVTWKYDGSEWSDVSPEGGAPRLMGVETSDSTPVLVSGAQGTLGTLTADGLEPVGPLTSHPLHAVWQDGHGGAWAVGGNIFQPQARARGVILRRPPSRNCPEEAIRGAGYHHLDIQGAGGEPRPDGTYPMFDVDRGSIHPDLTHGEHYIVGSGTYVEFTVPLCDDITDEVAFRVTNKDDPNSRAVHELFVVRDGREMLVARAVDTQDGDNGYIPFDRSSLPQSENRAIANTDTHPDQVNRGWDDFANASPFQDSPRDVLARPGDTLLYRATNLSDKKYGVMAWHPQNGLHYQTFLEVRVPETPGGTTGNTTDPPPEPTACATTTDRTFVEIGTDTNPFRPAPPAEIPVQRGPQGSLMFVLALRGDGFTPGDPADPLAEENPRVMIEFALDDWPDAKGRVLFDGDRRRGFATRGDHHLLRDVQATVNPGDASRDELIGHTVYSRIRVVDATSNETVCQRVKFTATAADQ